MASAKSRKKESLLGEFSLATCIAALEASFFKWDGIGEKAKGSGNGGQNQCKLHVVVEKISNELGSFKAIVCVVETGSD